MVLDVVEGWIAVIEPHRRVHYVPPVEITVVYGVISGWGFGPNVLVVFGDWSVLVQAFRYELSDLPLFGGVEAWFHRRILSR